MATENLSGRAAPLRTVHSAGLRLVSPTPQPPCAETIRFCEALLEEARNGDARGIAAAVAMAGRNYSVQTCGNFRVDPTYARGAVAALDDELRTLVHEASQ